jgi:hypothetical protein
MYDLGFFPPMEASSSNGNNFLLLKNIFCDVAKSNAIWFVGIF